MTDGHELEFGVTTCAAATRRHGRNGCYCVTAAAFAGCCHCRFQRAWKACSPATTAVTRADPRELAGLGLPPVDPKEVGGMDKVNAIRS